MFTCKKISALVENEQEESDVHDDNAGELHDLFDDGEL